MLKFPKSLMILKQGNRKDIDSASINHKWLEQNRKKLVPNNMLQNAFSFIWTYFWHTQPHLKTQRVEFKQVISNDAAKSSETAGKYKLERTTKTMVTFRHWRIQRASHQENELLKKQSMWHSRRLTRKTHNKLWVHSCAVDVKSYDSGHPPFWINT